MRIAPLAFCLDPTNHADRVIIRDVCRITHHSDEAYVGALAVLVAIKCAMGARRASARVEMARIAGELPDTATRERIEAFATSDDSYEDLARRYGNSGYVVESVPLAILAGLSMTAENFEDTLMTIIRAGGDTDTIASMAGQIGGAAIGLDGLPSRLVERLPDREMVMRVARGFAGVATTQASPSDHHPQP